jgi:localization factor PodJL
MRNASKDDILADVRARLSLIEGHASAAGADERQPARHDSDVPLSAALLPTKGRSLDALYASVAAVYAKTSPRPTVADSTPPARPRRPSWNEELGRSSAIEPAPETTPAVVPFEAWTSPEDAIFDPAAPPLAPLGGNQPRLAPVAGDPGLELIAQRLATLEEKLEAAIARAETKVPIEDILDRMDELKGQYQRVADEIGRLEVIEDNLARLIDEVAERQPDESSFADTVAGRVASQISKQATPAEYHRQHDDRRLADLEDMLSSYVNGRQSEETHTQQLLRAIHGLVATIDTRVGVIEHEIQMAAAEAPAREAPPPEMSLDDVDYPAEHESMDEVATEPETDLQIPADEFEPEVPPPGRQRPYEAAPLPEQRTLSPREQMIASARRAAQAAAAAQSPASNRAGGRRTETAQGASRLRAAVSNRTARFALDRKSPRPVVIMAVLALVLAGAGLLYGKMTRKPAGPKITIERSVDQSQTKKDKQDQVPDAEKQSGFIEELPGRSDNLETGSTDGTYQSDPMPLSPTRASIDADDAAGSDIIGAVSDELPPEGLAPLATRIKAANGDPAAQYAIAAQFARGALGQPDMAKAAEWYERAAAAGHAPSQYQLAAILERGVGVPQDAAAARKWYDRAARQGNVKAMHNLAVLMTTDEGGVRDYAAAAELFRQAADHGLADSQYNLAILYENGLGVKRATSEAYRWFALASEAGDKEAVRRRDTTRRRLSPVVVEEIDAEIKAWSPLPIDEAANSVSTIGTSASAETSTPVVAEAEQPPTKSDIVLVQEMLKSLGYEVGAPGLLDAKTSRAIASFEQRSKLPQTGTISDALISRLVSLAG